MHLSIAAIGSRGDVQPYLALGLGLQKAGYQVQFCTDRLFENLVTSTGLMFTPVTAAPVGMMQQNLSRIGGPIKFLGWLERHFKPLAHSFFSDLEVASRITDATLYSTLAFTGYHVAQKHGIPALAVYNVPITPTHAFQSPSFQPALAWFPFKKAYNWWFFRFTNQLFSADQPFWGQQVYQLGVGPPPIPFKKLSIENLANVIDRAVNDSTIHRKAEILGNKLRNEDGVGKAVQSIQKF